MYALLAPTPPAVINRRLDRRPRYDRGALWMLTNANGESNNKTEIFSALYNTASKPLGVSQASLDSFLSPDLDL